MNVKFRMPKFGQMHNTKNMLRELLMTTLGTTISIVLTFGTAAWIEHRQQEKNRRLTTMMVLSNIEDFVKHMRYIDSTLVVWDSTMTRIAALPRDRVLRLNDDECSAFITAVSGYVPMQRDKTAETIFTSDVSTWRDVGNLQFISNVGRCYSFINDIENNYRIQLDRQKELYPHISELFKNKKITPGERVAALLDLMETRQYINGITDFEHYLKSWIDIVIQFNNFNMKVTGVTREELTDFIEADEETTD